MLSLIAIPFQFVYSFVVLFWFCQIMRMFLFFQETRLLPSHSLMANSLLPRDAQSLPFLSPSFFQDGLKAVESLKPSIETLSTDLHTVSSLPLYGGVTVQGPFL